MASDSVPGESLVQLPTEIILSIAEVLAVTDLNSLLQSCRRFANLFNSRLYRLATTYTFTRQYRRKSPLTWAAEYGRATTVAKLLDAGADVTAVVDGFSAFHYAVQKGHANIARALLDAGANPVQPARDGEIPLTMAAHRGHEEIVRLLLEVTSIHTPKEQSEYKRALCWAVYCGHIAVVRFMLGNAGAIAGQSATGNAQGQTGWFDMTRDEDLLFEAARSGNCDMIRLLFDFGAKVPPVHRKSTHPLIAAAEKGHKEAVQLIMAGGGDPRYKNDKRDEAELQKAATRGQDDVAQFLLDSGPVTHAAGKRVSAMLPAAQSGHRDTVRLFQKYGTDLKGPGTDGRTPLQVALDEFSPPEVIHLLLDLGADPNIRGRGGSTALHTLVGLKRHDLLETLLSAGASLSIVDDDGNTPLLLAARESNVEAASIFIQCDADIMARDKQGRTPLHLAAWQGSTVIISMLLDAGADVSATDCDGKIPLHFATLSGNHFIFKAILGKHDKTSTEFLIRSKSGRTVLEMAVEGGHLSLVELLLKRNIEATVDREGYSPLHAAVANKHPNIAELLLSRGADPRRVDYYGRTPFDWAAADGEMLNRLVLRCDIPYTRTEPTLQRAILQDSVVRFASRILDGETGDFYKLAKCLVYLKEGEAALAVFREAARIGTSSDDLRYPMGCSTCRKRQVEDDGRSYFMVLVCRRCHDLDLCDWANKPPFLGFSSHAGFGVDQSRPSDSNDWNTPLWRKQLDDLITAYS